MKNLSTLLLLILTNTFCFSQLLYNDVEGIKDTSNFPELRIEIKIQNTFIKVDSNDVSAYFAREALYYKLGDYETCLTEQDKILKRFPKYSTDVYNNRGMCYGFLNQFELALKNLNKAKKSKAR
jgi:tetratricopeptide (TPR) repeat protein